MKRRVFAILAALSMLLFLAVVGSWLASQWQTHWAAFGTGQASYILRAVGGVVYVGRIMVPDHWENPQEFSVSHGPVDEWTNRWLTWPRPTLLNRTGFGVVMDGSTRRSAPWDVRVLMVPHWALAACAAAFPLIRFTRWRRRRPGLCPACGYDLRATPDRCPECGTASAKAPV